MGLNVNVTTRNKQIAILISILAVGGAAATGVMMIGDERTDAQKKPAQTEPSLTGVVTAAFDAQVSESALTQQQAKTSALESQMTKLAQQVEENKSSFEGKLSKKDEEIRRLTEQLAASSSRPNENQSQPVGANGTPLPNALSAGQSRPPEYTVTPVNGMPAATGATNMNQGTGFYPGGSGQRITGGLSSTAFTYDRLKKKPTKLPWIPSGSFSDAVMIEGADANASVTGQQNTTHVTFRLQGNVTMPNNHEYDMDGCFVNGEIWGDISSERGNVRTKNVSCILKNGKHVDMPFQGHASYQGKGGIRGKPVMRNGKIIGYAAGAGFLSGIGSGIKSASTPSVGLGATASVSGMDVLNQGFGGGSEKAADNLSQYWIKLAEQYHPVIDIGAGNLVTIVFQEGFRLETLEDAEDQKNEASTQEAGNSAQTSPPVNNGATTTSSNVNVGNINPDEILRKARELRLGDTIN
ncbi:MULTISPECIES: F-type conjugal transfer pilus assembly protein TraB [Pectobacterium]|uniref:F-type conjugal transfer pilus assembly protein TraB n=1 Tax=Pectobacterium TaxID=122277 RepID=UPI0013743874|nr:MULTISPECIES: F-type conjugal transfer pilus assembly protein TraB [Pectobacterium]QHP82821.1 conjugal transfer protein TraB [Pectobacterium odoriferum]